MSIVTRALMPPAVAKVAKWVNWSGNGTPDAPRIYGWSVRTRGTSMTYGSFEQSWLKASGFKHHGDGWGYIDESEPACLIVTEPVDSQSDARAAEPRL
jgi:hypothetical protein